MLTTLRMWTLYQFIRIFVLLLGIGKAAKLCEHGFLMMYQKASDEDLEWFAKRKYEESSIPIIRQIWLEVEKQGVNPKELAETELFLREHRRRYGSMTNDRFCIRCGKPIPLNTSEIYFPEVVNPAPPPFYNELCHECWVKEKEKGRITNR